MADAKVNNHHGKECDCCCTNAYGVAESMEEMDFNRSLWGACVIGDLERIERLISKGVDVNAEDSSGYAPLHYAARNGHSQACSVLLKVPISCFNLILLFKVACIDFSTSFL